MAERWRLLKQAYYILRYLGPRVVWLRAGVYLGRMLGTTARTFRRRPWERIDLATIARICREVVHCVPVRPQRDAVHVPCRTTRGVAPAAAGDDLVGALKIAFLATGNFSHVRQFAEFLVARGHDVHLVTYTDRNLAAIPGVTVHELAGDVDPRGAQHRKWRYFLVIPRLRRLLQTLRPHILHGHYVTSAGLLSMLSGFKPYVLTAHGSDLAGSVQSPVWRLILRRVFAEAAFVHAGNAYLGELARQLGVPEHKLLVAPLGLKVERFRYRLPRRFEPPLRLISTRKLEDVYDPQTIVAGCALLWEHGIPFHLTFAAGGSLEPTLREQTVALGIAQQVTFLGGYDYATLSGLLGDHDVYLSASRWDGTHLSLLEAMAAGLVPVVSRIPANELWLEDGRTGLMFTIGSARELADALARLTQGDVDWSVVTMTNRRRVEAEGDLQKTLPRLEERYLRLVADSRSRDRR